MNTSPGSVLMVSQPTVAGVAQCVLDWSVGLSEHGWGVTVACPTDGWLHTRLAESGIAVRPWQSQRSPSAGLRTESRALSSIISSTAADVVFANASKAGLISRLVCRGRRPLVFAPHSWSFEAVHGATASAALRWERLAARWTSRFVCVSDAERDLAYRQHIRGRFIVARNGVDVQALRPAQDRAALRQRLGISPDTLALVCVGRISEQKGQDLLLTAWPDIRSDHRTLTLIGDGPDLQALSTDNADPQVRFLGGTDRETALAWMAAADLVLLPSRWEGMALVPLESLALGTPVVATDVNGAREAITDTVGALCEPEDPVALSATVNSWLDTHAESPETVRSACRERVLDQFDLRDTVDTLDRVLQQVLGERR